MKITVVRAALLSVLIAPALSGGGHVHAAEVDTKIAAREHFQSGLAAYADERFAEAADEFDAAYRLSPAFKLLYNIGLVDVALGRSVEAIEAFDRYLKQGASAIAPDRRREVTAEIERQRGRIGTIAIRTFPEAADVRLDGVLVGQTPLAKPLPVNAGRHTVEAILAGHATQARSINVVGRAELVLEIVLEEVVARRSERPVPATERTASPSAAATQPPSAQAATAPPPSSPAPSPSSPSVTPIEGGRSNGGVERNGAAKFATEPHDASAESSVSWQRVFGYITAIGGLAVATYGGVTAYQGANQANDARTALSNATTDAEYDLVKPDYDAGQSHLRRGWIIAGIGTAALAGGIILIATAPQRTIPVRLVPSMTAHSAGLSIQSIW